MRTILDVLKSEGFDPRTVTDTAIEEKIRVSENITAVLEHKDGTKEIVH